jgi:hypothetical protein
VKKGLYSMLTPSSTTILIDGEALARARSHSAARFEKIVNWYRSRGVTDRAIAQAVCNAHGVISPGVLGGARGRTGRGGK